jgi:indolepyruvate ferredoxin oxidoreductase
MDAVQRKLRATPGVTVLIYDQECATERRRKRKRDLAPKAARRAVINTRVCEDCGDCSRTSNCLAVEPVETAFGRKRRIDQSACNQDFSCVDGFCPSFVTLEGAEPAKPTLKRVAVGDLPEPVLPEPGEDGAWNILLAGVGGQGVTALSAILGMAAHLEGRPGALARHARARAEGRRRLRAAPRRPGRARRTRASPWGASAPGKPTCSSRRTWWWRTGGTARPLLGPGRTVAVLNADLAPTAQFVLDTATKYDRAGMMEAVRAACREVVALPPPRRVSERSAT